jgi:SnoaL-like polyketide cyclase
MQTISEFSVFSFPEGKTQGVANRNANAGDAHRGDLNGIAPTGKPFVISGLSVVRFVGGKMAEGWINWDALGLMQQLRAVPELGKAKAVATTR